MPRLGRVLPRHATPRHGARAYASYPAERAREAVAGRRRDAIRKLEMELPAPAAHLDATIVTYRRYRAAGAEAWVVDAGGESS